MQTEQIEGFLHIDRRRRAGQIAPEFHGSVRVTPSHVATFAPTERPDRQYSRHRRTIRFGRFCDRRIGQGALINFVKAMAGIRVLQDIRMRTINPGSIATDRYTCNAERVTHGNGLGHHQACPPCCSAVRTTGVNRSSGCFSSPDGPISPEDPSLMLMAAWWPTRRSASSPAGRDQADRPRPWGR